TGKEQNGVMPHQFTASYAKDSIDLFRYYKKLAERAMAQCSEESLFTTIDAESNSIAIIVKHMAGNMRSRWRDFLTTDGAKPDRNRQIAHYAHHVGQIVFLDKHLTAKATGKWESLSVPRGQSKQFAADVAAGRKSQR